MRVISGSAKHLPLKTVKGMDTRPTTDRIKETLFNMLQNDIYGCRFLDLFSGSGAIGIEALSRGAACAVFVEQNPAAVSCIRENLSFTRLGENARVLQSDVQSALRRLQGEAPFDLVFLDPPYRHGLEREVLAALTEYGIVDAQSMIVVEAALDTEFPWLAQLGYEMKKYKKYKTNAHIFIEKQR